MNTWREEWKKRKSSVHAENLKFTQRLKRHKGRSLDRFAGEVHTKVFKNISCIECAGCCSTIPPMINKTDIERISSYLNISTTNFEQKYLTIDEDGDTVMNATPCPFLGEDNLCDIYEVRPKACRAYPHTDVNFSSNLSLHAINALYCPAVFHILENMKKNIPF